MNRLYKILMIVLLLLAFVVALLNEIGVIAIEWKNLLLLVAIFAPLSKWVVGKVDPPERKLMRRQAAYLSQDLKELKLDFEKKEILQSQESIDREIKRLQQLKSQLTPKAGSERLPTDQPQAMG